MMENKPRIVGIIPARYGSTRFEGKVLADLCGKPLIQHVYERAVAACSLSQVIVATDDQRVYQTVEAIPGEVVMTSTDHASGTDRVAEVARSLEVDIVVNIQGDEPFITPAAIDQVVQPLLEDGQLPMSTLAHPTELGADLLNPHQGKVVVNLAGFALYFSRLPIPFVQDLSHQNLETMLAAHRYLNTVGLYAYRKDFLLTFASLAPSPLEKAERLEQLRALEYGYPIKVVETEYAPLGVDTPEDLAKAVRRYQAESGRAS